MLDTATRLSMLQERFKSGTQKIYIESLNDALVTITGNLDKLNGIPELKRQIAIKRLVEQEINSLYGKLIEPIQVDMKDFAEVEYESIFDALNGTTGVGYAFAGLPKETMKNIISMNEIHLVGDKAYTLKELFDNAKVAQINNYKQIIAGGLASNSGYKAITKNLKDANVRATTNIDAIVHTAISSARDGADRVAYDEFDDVITGWKSISVLDSRTSLHCASLDGRMYYKKQGYPKYETIPNRPPRHFRCRSRLVAQTDFKTETTRAQNGDKKGQISSKTKFNEWFSGQSTDFKRNYLGKARYKLYESGKLQIKDFVDIKTGERFTIKEIREKFVGAKKAVATPKPKPKVEVEKKPAKKGVPMPVLNIPETLDKNMVVKTIENLHNRFNRPIRTMIFDVKMSAMARAGVGGDIEMGAMLSRKGFIESTHAEALKGVKELGVGFHNPSVNALVDTINHEYFHTLWQSGKWAGNMRALEIVNKKYGISYNGVNGTPEVKELYDRIVNNSNLFKKELSRIKSAYSRERNGYLKELRAGTITNEEYKDKIREISISDYGHSNADEFGAESFSGYVGKETPTKYEQLVGEAVEKYLVFKEDGL